MSLSEHESLFRIIPCLLLQGRALVKTKRFASPTYIGDPINAVRIFTEKGADEVMLIDIDATVSGAAPDLELLRDIASQAFMPVCYGGGIRTLKQMEEIYQLGVEKLSVSSAALLSPELVREAAQAFGSQSVVVTLDVKKSLLRRDYHVVSHRGKRKWPGAVLDWVERFEQMGVGEIIINNVDRDGTMIGYDHNLLGTIAKKASVPVVSLGGAQDVEDMEKAIRHIGVAGAAAGSIFVFKGPHRAVLISYPARAI